VARIQVGPRPNAVGCTINPTRLGGAPHCRPVINLGSRGVFNTTGRAKVLRRLQDARGLAQRSGITIDGVPRADGTIAVSRVFAPLARRPTIQRPSRPPGPALKRAAVRPSPAQTAAVRAQVKATRPVGAEVGRAATSAVRAFDELERAFEVLEAAGISFQEG